ncbi:MAG TPA: hypothetical protein VGL95_17775 [Acetobacteraceae bacterium]
MKPIAEPPHHPPLPPGDYPRIYRMRPGWLIFLLLPATITLSVGLLGVGVLLVGTSHPGKITVGISLLRLIPFGLVLGSAYVFANELSAKVILYADAIEVVRSLSRRRLRRSEIWGRRLIRGTDGVGTLVIIPNRGDLPRLKIAGAMRSDSDLNEWIAALPDLDAEDARQVAARYAAFPAEVATDDRWGGTATERVENLRRARKLVRTLNGCAIAASVWCVVFPYPYYVVLALTLAIPWLAVYLVIRSHRLLRLLAPAHDPHPNFTNSFLLPGLALMMRAFVDTNTVGWLHQLAVTVIGSVLVGLGVAIVHGRFRLGRTQVLAVLFAGMPYAYGLGMITNQYLDGSSPTIYRTTILGKDAPAAPVMAWNVQLAAWGPRRIRGDAAVRASVYESVEPGQEVCVALRPGAFGIPWFAIRLCD